MVKVEYPHLLADEPEWHARAEELASRTFELADFLVNQLKVIDVGARYEGRIAYHYACHLRGLKLAGEVEQLIRHVQGATLMPLRHEEQCCGFGGSFSVRYPHVSTAMVNDKVNCILQTEADALVSTDAGCLMNIGGRLRRREKQVEVMHIAELLVRQ
jgi:L-lactate dehydrogenase complex protein LldE